MKETGGQAFPRSPHSGDASDDGMTLRDYFAAHAPDEATNVEEWKLSECAQALGVEKYDYHIHFRPLMAKLAYEYADAMLAERAK